MSYRARERAAIWFLNDLPSGARNVENFPASNVRMSRIRVRGNDWMAIRRRLLIVLGRAPFMPRAAFAQAKKPPVLIGWLSLGSRKPGRSLDAFKDALAALGWKGGTQFVIEGRWAEG